MREPSNTESGFPADGRYLGNNGLWWVDLRVDLMPTDTYEPVGAVSADIQSTRDAGPALCLSVCTVAGGPPELGSGPLEITWTGSQGATASGSLTLIATTDKPGFATAKFTLAEGFEGLPRGTEILADVVRVCEELRDLDLAVHVEENLGWPVQIQFGEDRLDTRECLRRAGFSVIERPPTKIPKLDVGWDATDIFSRLSDLMSDGSESSVPTPAWQLDLMVLHRTTRDGLLGLMFDQAGGLPRQGAAIFVDEIKNEYGGQLADERIIETAIHEIGHAFNLTHRFGRDVRRSNSPSPMNYDWRFRGGEHIEDYWHQFDFRFDPDELRFLRHGARSQVIPGGSAFGSARYWATIGQATPGASDEKPWSDLRLWLTPPPAGTTFAFGQPVFLTVSLLNTGTEPVNVSRHALDIKAGQLDMMVQIATSTASANGGGSPNPERLAMATPFIPILRRCFSLASAGSVSLGPGESMHTNANLTYGSGGFSFPDPGAYEITPLLTFPAEGENGDTLDHVVKGASLRILVTPPQPGAEERDLDILQKPSVGATLALGGADSLQGAADELEEVKARRQREGAGSGDPVVAAITRAAGIHHGRKGRFAQATSLLAQATTPAAAATFDPHTAEHTRRLAARFATEAREDAPAPTVVVDLYARSGPGHPKRGGRVAGVLVAAADPADPGKPGRGLVVMAPADLLPIGAMHTQAIISAGVVATTTDGLTERISVERVQLIGPDDETQGPALALLLLSHPVPAAPLPQPAPGGGRIGPDADLWNLLVGPSVSGADLLAPGGEDPGRWATAADQAMADAPPAGSAPGAGAAASPGALDDPSPVITHSQRQPNFDDVGDWRCLLTTRCTPGAPPGGLRPPWPNDTFTRPKYDTPRLKPNAGGRKPQPSSETTDPPQEQPQAY